MTNVDDSHMTRIVEYMDKKRQCRFEIEINKMGWTCYIYNPLHHNDPYDVFIATGASYSEALAKLSKLVYEEAERSAKAELKEPPAL